MKPMNAIFEQTILERLHGLNETRQAEVLDFVEFLAYQQAMSELGSRNSRLAGECAKLDPRQEQAFAETGLAEDVATWPEY